LPTKYKNNNIEKVKEVKINMENQKEMKKQLGIVIIICLSILGIILGVEFYTKQTYVKTEATITDVGTIKNYSSGSGKHKKTTRRQQCTLTYIYDNTEYRLENTTVKVYSLFGYKENEKITIYVDPENPETYLTFNDNPKTLIVILTVVFLIIIGFRIGVKKGYITLVNSKE
jgi:hypothetical protein